MYIYTVSVLNKAGKRSKRVVFYHQQLQTLELNQQKNEQRHKRIIGFLMFYSILFYIAGAVIFYFYYFPKLLKDKIIRTIPLLIFPLL